MVDRTRRNLLKAATLLPLAYASGSLAAGAIRGGTATASFAIDAGKPGRVVSESLASLSYETEELSDPTFFAADNHGLVKILRELNPHGVLRIGGNSSDDTVWSGYHGSLPAFVPRRVGPKQPHVLQPEGLQALAGFLKATGWQLIFGVNLRIGSPAMAVSLAQAVKSLVGDQLLAIQIGNEPNDFTPDFATYNAKWMPYAQALRAAGMPLGGPDTGANTDWVLEYAKLHAKENVLLSRHYYRGAAEDGSIANLLSGDPGFFRGVDRIMQAADKDGLPFRITEGNSYYNGGRDGTSNVFASALWGTDFMLALAQRGVAGMHFHGGTLRSVESSLGRVAKVATGGDIVAQRAALASRYSAIAGSRALGFQPQPLFHGIALAQRFAGARMLPGTLDAGGVNLTAYAAAQGEGMAIALVNKDAANDATVNVSGLRRGAHGELMRLRAPALDSRRDIRFAADGALHADAYGACRIHVPRASAAYLRLT